MDSAMTQAARTVLEGMIDMQREAWNRNDAVAWCSVFTHDARFTTLRGDVFVGHQAIEASHRFIFSSFYKGSQVSTTVESIVFPAPDVAVMDALHEVSAYAFLPPGISSTDPGVLRARMKYVAVLQAGKWMFMSAQNTAVFPKPASS